MAMKRKWERLGLPKPEVTYKRKGRGVRSGRHWCHGCEDWQKDSMFDKDERGYARKFCRLHGY